MQRVGHAMIWVVGALVGCSVARSAPTSDYAGQPVITEPAPNLTFERRDLPRPGGIDYPFAEQTAQGVAVFDRFPEFSLRDRWVHWSGPWYSDPAANGHFTHGVTSIEVMPNYRQGPSNNMAVPAEHKWMLMMDPLWWRAAGDLADQLAAADPADARIPALRLLADEHRMIPDEAAYVSLGRFVWEHDRTATDDAGRGFRYAMIDIEGTEGWEHHRDCFGWMYRGLGEASAADGEPIVPVTYGSWTFMVGLMYFSERQNGTGEPVYLLPEHDFVPQPDPTLNAVDDLGGALSMDGYLQAIWGEEPFYQRHPDGSLVLADGVPQFSTLDHTTLYGQPVRLEPGEAEHTLSDLYRQAARMYLMYHRMAGEYPSHSGLRKPFLTNSRVGGWTRVTNEGLLGIEQNDRPVPAWELELMTMIYLMTADHIVAWGVETNCPPAPPASDMTDTWRYNAHGVWEAMLKAMHRYSVNDPLHEPYEPGGEPFQWCWFNLPMVEQNKVDGERYDQKPLVIGKIRQFEGRSWLELMAAWPAMDDHPAELLLWVDQDGQRSPAYPINLRNGRSIFYDAWRLPEQFEVLTGEDVWLRFTDQLGVERTWRGDWRLEVDATVPTPPRG